MIAVGTAATRGIAPLRLYDLLSGAHLMDLGSELMPVPVRRHAVEDRVWSVGVSSGQQQVDFTCLRNLDWPSI